MSFQVAFLVGGLGSRLGTLTATTPKPLLPVRGRPFLDHLIDFACRHGAGEILLIAGYLGEQIRARYDGTARGDTRLAVVVEATPAGTGSALRVAAPALRPEFVLANGDTYFDVKLAELIRPASRLARMALRRVDDVARYGAVALGPDGAVTGFGEKTGGGPGLANGGLYRLDRRVLSRIPPMGACSLEHEVFPGLAAEGELEGQVFDGAFIDIGVPEDLARAERVMPG
ncbi:MAG TPA: sugar phosphate nucleotidyltransferase [Stellaceae bacterium]|nr:sugar phosphate nucleotidyltransferase [Stellaceae bacterium]